MKKLYVTIKFHDYDDLENFMDQWKSDMKDSRTYSNNAVILFKNLNKILNDMTDELSNVYGVTSLNLEIK